MSLEISHIVTNGCSFTYCQGIHEPWNNGWPALLGKKLGVPVVNLAVGGSGNDAIQRRTYEYFYKNKKLVGKPLYITAFSHATRREEFFKNYKGNQVEEYMGLDLGNSAVDLIASLGPKNKRAEEFEVAHILNLNYEACERKKILLWNSVVNLFKANGVPYVVGDYMPSYSIPVQEYMMENYREIYEEALLDKNNIGDINVFTKHMPKLKCSHETIEAMPLVCEAFYNKLTEVYGEIKPITKIDGHPIKFLTLKEFYSQRVQTILHWHEWIKNT